MSDGSHSGDLSFCLRTLELVPAVDRIPSELELAHGLYMSVYACLRGGGGGGECGVVAAEVQDGTHRVIIF